MQQSEHRLLEQKAGAAAIIFSSILGQVSTAVSALAAAVKPDGTVDQAVFAGTSAALSAPQPSSSNSEGGLGATATALFDVRTVRVLASSGTLRLDVTTAAGATRLSHGAAVASTESSHAVILGLIGQGKERVLALLASAPAGVVVYLEFPEGNGRIDEKLPPLFEKAFGGLDFSVYVGPASPENLMFTNAASGRLDGDLAEAYVGAGSTTGFENTSYEADRRPVQIVLKARSPLTGRLAHELPWLLLGFGLLSGGAVVVLMEKTQRRRDEAVALVGQLEARHTELEDAVQRRQQAEERLQQSQRLEAIGQLAGGIAHDFNNLLAVIFSYVGFLKVHAEGQPWAEDVAEVDRAARRAAELTTQLLMFSRREPSRPTVIDARGLVFDRFRLLQRTLGENIEVTLDLPEHEVPVMADAVELDQVVMNLVVNARDALQDGGRLRLAIREVPSSTNGTDVQLIVADTGAGMDEEVRQHAFEPFFTTKEVGRGTGLGLATVYGIATRYGGTVTIDSAIGLGTTVTVTLPRAEEEVERAVAEPIPGDSPKSGRVLLVEDDESVRRAAERILSEAGFTVTSAANGPEALALFTQQPFDVLVSDVVMPGGMSGPELAERLRIEQPSLPVVLASGHSPDSLTRKGPLPADMRVVNKPFDASVLIRAVELSVGSREVAR